MERDNKRERSPQTEAWSDNRQWKEYQGLERPMAISINPTIADWATTRENSEMLVSDLFLPNSHVWNREKIKDILPGLESTITHLKPSVLGAEDKLAWLGNPSSVYSAKSGYHCARERPL